MPLIPLGKLVETSGSEGAEWTLEVSSKWKGWRARGRQSLLGGPGANLSAEGSLALVFITGPASAVAGVAVVRRCTLMRNKVCPAWESKADIEC